MTKIIDCTIRDGGHLNNWKFDIDFVKQLYSAAIKSGVDYFEVGYRNIKNDNYGNFASCDDDFLFSVFDVAKNCKLSVMADAGKTDFSLFKKCLPDLTPISMVRIATYPEKLDEAFNLCEKLKNKGYETVLNLMAFAKYNEKDIEKLQNWENKELLNSVCYSDSFGSFLPDDVMKYYEKLKECGFNSISFHAHNNLQLAFANSITAINADFYSVDASLNGIGRCAGITPVELILWYLKKINNEKYNPIPYLEFIFSHKNEINTCSVENRLKAIIGGIKNIHPNYINELFNNSKISLKDIIKQADNICNSDLISHKSGIINKE